RSSTLLKVKRFHDPEARILKHLEGAGRHKPRLGALFVELADGTTFSVGTGFSDKERERPPAVGSTITFRYQELSEAGVPRFPSFVGIHTEAPAKPSTATKGTVSVKATPTAGSSRFEFSDGKSSKFWEITSKGTTVTVRY